MDVTEYRRRYNLFSAREKLFLQLVALAYYPRTQTWIYEACRDVGMTKSNGKAFTSAEAKALLRAMRAKGFLTDDNTVVENLIDELLHYAVDENNLIKLSRVVVLKRPRYGYQNAQDAYVALRASLFLKDGDNFEKLLIEYCRIAGEDSAVAMIRLCLKNFNACWISSLPPKILCLLLEPISIDCWFYAADLKPRQDLLNQIVADNKLPASCDTTNLNDIFNILKGSANKQINGVLLLLDNKIEDALLCFKADLIKIKNLQKKRYGVYSGYQSIFYFIALLASCSESSCKDAQNYLKALSKSDQSTWVNSIKLLEPGLALKANRIGQAQDILLQVKKYSEYSLWHLFCYSLSYYWVYKKIPDTTLAKLTEYYDCLRFAGANWLALEVCALLIKVDSKISALLKEEYKKYAINFNGLHFVDAISHEQDWRRSLKALSGLGDQEKETATITRLSWLLQFDGEIKKIIPIEQKLSKTGRWTKGRKVSLERLYREDNIDFVSEQDRVVSKAISMHKDYHGAEYEIDLQQAISALIDHPNIFDYNDSNLQIQLHRGCLDLVISEEGENIRFALGRKLGKDELTIEKLSTTLYRVYEVESHHRELARILGSSGLVVPAEARQEVMLALENIASFMTVHSSIVSDAADVVQAEAYPKLVVHLAPLDEGIIVDFLATPFNENGPAFIPGDGGEVVMATIDGQKTQIKRDLNWELNVIDEVLGDTSIFTDEDHGRNHWELHTPDQALEVLVALNASKKLDLKWPKGGKIGLSSEVNLSDMKVKVEKNHDWFDLDGSINVDGQVIELAKLLELSETATSRFISLGDRKYLRLTRELKRCLDEINALALRNEEGLQINPLLSESFLDVTKEIENLTVDAKWTAQVKRIEEVRDMVFEVPKDLNATLRDYQLEGFQWLSRLAAWGVGACLADDMGLGKTLQSLSVILNRACEGPSLVAAPTSVCNNWIEEIHKFTPTLRAVHFVGKFRHGLIKNIGANDIVIVSYTLLQSDNELFKDIEWQTVILDEAQAIKNVATKRSKAAMGLNAKFKIITTGTPIENHLGELWNLFEFINPGLLGRIEDFQNKYAIPIERHQDALATARLRHRVRPFILRRLKTDVLDELPSRTDILLNIELGEEERKFYDALRFNSIKKLEQTDGAGGKKRMQILAEIMKLRRAACHPKLVDSGTIIPGSKLKAFTEILEHILENNHKVLIFSQFTAHLDIIRQTVESKNINYQYLDGKTPAGERRRSVADFQKGIGDVFLISLRAGGVGLNLTAADYVIHMDPWWNPAVEDQASDRAYRIGQKRPVTIYRLVCQDTIEEKIVNLHHQKRDLAGSLLDGTHVSARLSADDLLKLIKDE